MSNILPFPGKASPGGEVLVLIHGYWSGPIFRFEVTSSAIPNDDNRLTMTNNFDAAVRAAFVHAQTLQSDTVKFMLSTDDMFGRVA